MQAYTSGEEGPSLKNHMTNVLAVAIPSGVLYFWALGVVLLFAIAYVVVRWVRWAGIDELLPEPRWRTRTALFGFAVSTIALLLIVGIWIHAAITGGFPLCHPVRLFLLRVWFWVALTGLAGGLIGKGQLRIPALLCSAFCFLVWLSEAMLA